MSTLIYMKVLERAPANYDRGMRLLTLGRVDRIKREIASAWVAAGHDVLEIGCGAGSLSALLTERGARVIGIDTSDKMLAVARKNAPEAEFIHLTATEIDRLAPRRFDRVVATFSFSEFSEDEVDLVLRETAGILKPDGKLVVADEAPPAGWWRRTASGLVRWPLAALVFLLTQGTTHALKGFEERLEAAGFHPVSRREYLFGTLMLIVAEKN